MLVTIVTLHREPFFEDPAIAREAIETLYRVQQLHPFFLYGFVFMPDHCHLLLKVPAPATVAHRMGVFKSGLTFNAGIPKMWQARFHIRCAKSPFAALRYIHSNPVRSLLAKSPEEYPWSSASGKWDVSSLDIG